MKLLKGDKETKDPKENEIGTESEKNTEKGGLIDRIPLLNDDTKAMITRDKKQIIRCGIFVLAMIVTANIAKGVSGMCGEILDDENRAYSDLRNEVEQYQASNRLYTGISESILTADKTSVKWTGDRVEVGRWMADEAYFWTWIEPAFNYKNATEYASMRADYLQQTGHCLFTDQFLAPYDPSSDKSFDKNGDGELSPKEIENANAAFNCTSSKNGFITYPIGAGGDGSYAYLALVPMRRSGTSTSVMTAFTYSVVHHDNPDGTEKITISGLECWPADPKQPMRLQ